MIRICDYCHGEISDEDWVFDGLDYCCRDCAEDFCEYCGDLLTPSTSLTYMGMCQRCFSGYEEE